MAYDEALANRLRTELQGQQGLSEKRMFGGLAFLVNGRLAVSASSQGGLLLRVDPAAAEALLQQPHAERAVMRGRQLRGWLRVAAQGLESDDDFTRWVSRSVTYARSLPSK